MRDQAEATEIKSALYASVFFKCPVGGFASLRLGSCPKCGESLVPITAPARTGAHVIVRARIFGVTAAVEPAEVA